MKQKASLFKRFLTYQKERYPLIGYFFLIGSFSFSAIAYSRICRGITEFVSPDKFFVCIFNTITLFFILRISDEFKDREDDRKYRAYLPVPRGLISLNELKYIGIAALIFQLIITSLFFSKMLFLLAIVYFYLFFMSKEFFVKKWLKRHQFWYVTSHMLIIPLIDVFASGFDWLLENEKAPTGLLFFFAVSFMNGIVLEIGRKIKSPEQEEKGVLSYTFQLGTKPAAIFWIFILLLTLILALTASYFAGHSITSYIALISVFAVCTVPPILFLIKQNARNSKLIEYGSTLWTFSMYLILGGIPMLIGLLK
ncbi:UbiA family prenyltransferase [Fluviicola sp.]|jgi:4-hydroxybenzoate polyprenyltransferase|uniref:UbiA family prenyltransferase n=1 Tax=Fluviicola sp. TaxID=1917219 RepID=UPI00281BE6CB|nr:UbiA family prenyltransferase [Fluviicola sp.]MDR0803405.1 UbiA family prenyltransferase [Fluviicola sp.]